MKTLELNQLKYYLGTGLKVEHQGNIKEMVYMYGNNETHIGLNAIIVLQDKCFAPIPLMLPLSALTEPVLEGGKVPIVELAKMAEMLEPITFDVMEDFSRGVRGVCAKDRFNNQWLMYDFNHGLSMWHKPHNEPDHRPTLLDNQLVLFEQLFQWHIWPFDQSLFESGVLIDKRNVK